MENPPLTHNLQAALHSDTTSRSVHIAGLIAVIAVFLVTLVSSYAYMNNEEARAYDQRPSLVASVAQSDASSTPADSFFASTTLIAQGAYVYDTTDQVTLYDHNGDTQLPLASLTKVPLMLAVSEVLTPDMLVTIPRTTTPTVDASTLYAGTTFKVRDLVDFMLVASSNETASTLAQVADEPLRKRYPNLPKGEAAVARMRQMAQELGLSQTFFMNVTGLDESSRQAGSYGSPKDMATLFASATTHADLFSATQKEQVTISATDGTKAVAHNTNDALPRIPNLILGKTGYTILAGGNLAVVFKVHDHVIVATVMGSTKTGRFSDMTKLVTATQNYFAQ